MLREIDRSLGEFPATTRAFVKANLIAGSSTREAMDLKLPSAHGPTTLRSVCRIYTYGRGPPFETLRYSKLVRKQGKKCLKVIWHHAPAFITSCHSTCLYRISKRAGTSNSPLFHESKSCLPSNLPVSFQKSRTPCHAICLSQSPPSHGAHGAHLAAR